MTLLGREWHRWEEAPDSLMSDQFFLHPVLDKVCEHTAHEQKSMSRRQCHGPCPLWNFLEMKLLSTENTTPAKGASGFYWCLVHFDGAWVKCAEKFPGAWRLSSPVTGFCTYYLRQAEGRCQALLRAGPGREERSFQEGGHSSGLSNELPNLDWHDSFGEWREPQSWD